MNRNCLVGSEYKDWGSVERSLDVEEYGGRRCHWPKQLPRSQWKTLRRSYCLLSGQGEVDMQRLILGEKNEGRRKLGQLCLIESNFTLTNKL